MVIDNKKNKKDRIWEIDLIRGIMVVIMIIVHILYDLEQFYNIPINYSDGVIKILTAGPGIFILVSGTSVNFSKSSFKRGLIVLVAALAITLFSLFFNPDYLIVFGILHFLGICMIISPILKKMSTVLLFVLSIVVASTIFIIPHINVDNNYLFMFGIYNDSFVSADYFPLFPWASVFVLGVVIGRLLYKEKKSVFKFRIKDNPVNFIGRHSLIIYLIHQPIVLVILSIIMR